MNLVWLHAMEIPAFLFTEFMVVDRWAECCKLHFSYLPFHAHCNILPHHPEAPTSISHKVSGSQTISSVSQELFLLIILSEIPPSMIPALHSEIQMLWEGSWKKIGTQMKGVRNNWIWETPGCCVSKGRICRSQRQGQGYLWRLAPPPLESMWCREGVNFILLALLWLHQRGARHVGAVDSLSHLHSVTHIKHFPWVQVGVLIPEYLMVEVSFVVI